jgi:hypothetical protein
MSDTDIQALVADLYNSLVENGCNPLTVAATFMVTAFMIYSKQLSPESYAEVISNVFSKANTFIDKSHRILH